MRTPVVAGLIGGLIAALSSCTSDDARPAPIPQEAGAPGPGGPDASLDDTPSEPVYYGWDASVPGQEGNSCRDLDANCGPNEDEDCCTSLFVPGGTFYRSYDGVTFTDRSWPATVSDFRLDKYEATASRFDGFRRAWSERWRPPPGSGKHVHLNEGRGLFNAATEDFEAGWDPRWSEHVSHTSGTRGGTNHPTDLINWYEAYAFCIWDGGFLPSEAEWNYAAAGGSEQRVFPWSVPPDADDELHIHVCLGDRCCTTALVGSYPEGNGRWGHADLMSNVDEPVLDSLVNPMNDPRPSYPLPCDDCMLLLPEEPWRVMRGGPCYAYVRPSFRLWSEATEHGEGVRCARPPVHSDAGQ